MKPVLAYLLVLVYLISAVSSSDTGLLSDEDKLKKILDDLLATTSNDDLEDTTQFRRDKKARPSEQSADEQKPLSSHGRKTFLPDPSGRSSSSSSSMCDSSYGMVIETDKMIDTKDSVANGGVYLKVEKIDSGSTNQIALNELQKTCARACCENQDGCDTALLSLEPGRVGTLIFF